MGFWSSVGSAVKSAGSAIVSAGRTVISKAKEVAVNAVNWMADKAEHFVGKVKDVWNKVQPFIKKHIRPYLTFAAAVAPWPWLGACFVIINKALQHLEHFENSSLARKLDQAIKWAISTAKFLKEKFLTPEEEREAEQRKKVFEEAANTVPSDQRHAINLAGMINDYVLVRTAITNIMESNSIKDFEHYLRLRATQKLMQQVEKVLSSAQSIEDITEDDIFLLKVGADLLSSDPKLSDADAIKLDQIIYRMSKKKLIPFVFEEMVMAWSQNLQQLESEWKSENTKLSKNEVIKRRLEVTARISELEPDEKSILDELTANAPLLKNKLEQLGARTREMKNYVYASEGFLQTLEKSPEEIEAEELDYLTEDGSHVGMIIIDCAQHGKRWNDLSADDQSLIIDFANIFEKASKARAAQLVEVEVGA